MPKKPIPKLEADLVNIVTGLGYTVTKGKNQWGTVSQLAERVDRSLNSVSRSLKNCPFKFPHERSERGRILKVEFTPDLLSYLLNGKVSRP